jgi:DHA1 family multidrug resistance protein-like MFS transporter
MGLGGVFFDAASNGVMACFTTEKNRNRVFAVQATVNNIGAALGPVIAFFLLSRWGFYAVGLVSAGFFLWAAIQAFLFLPDAGMPVEGNRSTSPLTMRETFAAIWACKSWFRVVVLLIGFWIIASQMSMTVPLAAMKVGGRNAAAFLATLNAFLAIPLQYPLIWLSGKHIPPMIMMALSSAITGIGLVSVFMAPDLVWQAVGVALITVGTLAVLPVMQLITARVAPPRAVAAFYGFSVLGLGIGGGAGQYIGGRLFDLQQQVHMPWLMAAFSLIVGIVVAMLIWRTPAPTAVPLPTSSSQKGQEFDPSRSGVVAAR